MEKKQSGNVEMSKLKRNLKIVFDETAARAVDTIHPSACRRYHAKSLDGGAGWGVFDKKLGRFLKDREVAALTDSALRESWSN